MTSCCESLFSQMTFYDLHQIDVSHKYDCIFLNFVLLSQNFDHKEEANEKNCSTFLKRPDAVHVKH